MQRAEMKRQDPRKRNELDKSNRGGRATNGKEEERRESYPGEEVVDKDEEEEEQLESYPGEEAVEQDE